MAQLRIAMAQMNAAVGDLEGNTEKILKALQRAKRIGVDIVTFPELMLSGCPPQDLLWNAGFLADSRRMLDRIVEESEGLTVIGGCVNQQSEALYNAAVILHDGCVLGVQRKAHLANCGLFDESRYFQAGAEAQPLYLIRDLCIGVMIGEEIQAPEGPLLVQALNGANLIVHVAASPYYAGEPAFRERLLAARAVESGVTLASTNMIGGQDQLIFSGAAVIVNPQGTVLARGRLFEEDLVIADLDVQDLTDSKLRHPGCRGPVPEMSMENIPRCRLICAEPADAGRALLPLHERPLLPANPKDLYAGRSAQERNLKELYDALTLGLRDYVRKNGFTQVVLGLSGGIDSALVAALAVDALGPDHVLGVLMPGPYSSQGSIDDALALVEHLKIAHRIIAITPIYDVFLEQLAAAFEGCPPNVAEENIQARCRGVVLMGIANKFGSLTLTTGNKSEVSVGYATLYGDMAGGLGVISDLPKTKVYALARYRNQVAGYDLIPAKSLDKPPSAELRENQKDSDSLPDYQVLDAILSAYLDEHKCVPEIVELGYEPKLVSEIIRRVDRSEYKRQQAAPGLKVSTAAFGLDRRLPMTNSYRCT